MIAVNTTRFQYTMEQFVRLKSLMDEWKDADIDDIIVLMRKIRRRDEFGKSTDRLEIIPDK